MIRLPNVTLCLIVKNEAENLPKVLRHGKLFSRILVIDTGSSDGTIDLARELGADVESFEWCDDFSKARNRWSESVKEGWIFWLDADDEITEETALRTLELAANAPESCVGFMYEYEYPNGYICDHIRLYRADRNIRWRGRIHEHLDFREAGAGKLLPSGARIQHTGFPAYDPEALEARSRRNNRLLEIELENNPKSAIVHQYIAMDHQAHGKHALALEWFEKALKLADVEKDRAWLPDMYCNMARSYVRAGRKKDSERILQRGMNDYPKIFPVFMQRHLNLKTPDGRTAEELGRSRSELLRALS